MSAAISHQGHRWSAGAVIWLVWMEAMWIVFFALLLAGELQELRDAVRDLPLVVELLAWLAFFPWLLGTAVWTGSWSEPARVLLVLTFAIGWSLLSIPRRKPAGD
jgi:hypothetical protein